jgi:hypothetical protein
MKDTALLVPVASGNRDRCTCSWVLQFVVVALRGPVHCQCQCVHCTVQYSTGTVTSLTVLTLISLSWILSLLPLNHPRLPFVLALTENALPSLAFLQTQRPPSQPTFAQKIYRTTALQTIQKVPTKRTLNLTSLHQTRSFHQYLHLPAPGEFVHTADVTPFRQSSRRQRILIWIPCLLVACMLLKCPMRCFSLPSARTPHFLPSLL